MAESTSTTLRVAAARPFGLDESESVAVLRAFFDNAPSLMGVVELLDDGDVFHVSDNAAACAFFGVEPGGTAGHRATELGATLETIAEWRRHYDECARTGRPIRFEYRYDTAEGPQWLAVAVARTGTSKEGQPRFCYVAENVTARKRAEALAREADARSTAILESITDAFFALDEHWRFTYVNREACRALARTPEDLVGKVLWDVYPNLRGTDFEGAYRRCLEERRATSVLAYYPDHRRFYDVRAYPAGRGLTVYFRDVTEAKRAEEQREELLAQLRTSDERYRTLCSSIDQGFCVGEVLFDERGVAYDYRFLEANEMFERHSGYAVTPGRTVRDIVPNVEPLWPSYYGRVAQTGEPLRFVEESRALGRWFDVYAFRVGEPERRCVAMLFSDITERKKAEDALRASERRERERAEELETIMRAVPGAIWISRDRDCETIVGNPESYRVVRMPEGANTSATGPESAGRPFREHRDGRPLEPSELPMQVAARTGEIVHDSELSFVFDDGVVHHVFGNAAPLRGPDGDVRGVVAAFVDITELKEAAAELRRRERELQTLADNSPYPIARFDKAFRHVFANTAVERVTGRRRAEFLGKSNRDLGIAPELWEVWDDALRSVFERGEPRSLDFPYRDPSGTLRHFASRYVPELGPDGTVEHVLVVTHDRTAEKHAEDALREADQRKDEFLAVLAHELRNPLAPLRTGLHVLATAQPGDASWKRVRAIMERQLGHLVRLVDDLLDVSRISRGKLELKRERVELRSILESALEASRPLLERATHEVTVDTPETPLVLLADPTRLAQVVTNLLNNAAKYTSPGGQVALRATREGGTVVLRVTDNGTGIPREMLDKVFDLFTQVDRTLERSQQGLGIGLALAKRLVEMHGGTITAESAGPGTGSTFTVRLPLAEAVTEERASQAEAAPAAVTNRRILVVDDNEDGAEMLVELLALRGYDCRIAHDGRTALATARAWRPDLVFLDIGLPDMTGYDVAASLRSEPPLRDVPLVALTGWGSAADKRRAYEAGFAAHLTKPADLAAVDQILSGLPARGKPVA